MEHVAAIMMLVGCSYGNADCRELPNSLVSYETVEECQEMLRPTVSEIQTSAKVVYGKCEAIDPALLVEDLENARVRWTVTPEDELHVRIDVEDRSPPVMLASR